MRTKHLHHLMVPRRERHFPCLVVGLREPFFPMEDGKETGRPLDLRSGAPRPSLDEEPEPLLPAPGAAAPRVPPSDEDVRGTGIFRPDAEDPLVSAIDFASWCLISFCLLLFLQLAKTK